MKVRPLRTYNLPDIADRVIHFTGRAGKRLNVDSAIEALPDEQRLLQILIDQKARGFETFGADGPVACLTESTRVSILSLLGENRYTPCGVEFTKQFVFDRGGGPALYIRGDEWPAAQALPQPLRSRIVRFWPGAEPDYQGEEIWPSLLAPSEWLHEREWRVPGDLAFSWADVAFLIVPNSSWQSYYSIWIASWAGEEYAQWFESIPAVVMSQDGAVVDDGKGIWT
jgi:hypothetical protein